MNEFEKDSQSKNLDVADSIKGFTFSFLYFVLIFAIGVFISVLYS
ncbi:MAG TPA: YqzM family protein [Cerasibacillus sp.]